jgi:hypothetical protein
MYQLVTRFLVLQNGLQIDDFKFFFYFQIIENLEDMNSQIVHIIVIIY